MKLTKSIEIVQLNINIAGPKMPPDCLDALKLCLEAAKRLQLQRKFPDKVIWETLPGETTNDHP